MSDMEIENSYRAPGPQPRQRFVRDNDFGSVRTLDELPEDLQNEVLNSYERERKKLRWAYILWVIPPGWHYFYLGRVGRGFLMIASLILPVIWLVWWVIEALRMQSRISEANADLTDRLLRVALSHEKNQEAAETPDA